MANRIDREAARRWLDRVHLRRDLSPFYLRYSRTGREKVHATNDRRKTLCGVQFWISAVEESKDVNCDACLREAARLEVE